MQDARYDLHIHSDYSDGSASIAEIVNRARTLGIETIAIADHFWPSLGSKKGGRSIIENRRREIEVARAEHPSLRVLDATEVDIQSNGSLAPVAGGLEQFDIIIGSFHWSSDSTRWVSALSKITKSSQFNILGHWDGYLSSYREEDGEMAARALAEARIAIELNERYKPEHIHFLETANEHGCMFTLGSDSHSVETVGRLENGKRIAADYNLRVIDAHSLLEYCVQHK